MSLIIVPNIFITNNESLANSWNLGERKLNYKDDIFCIRPGDNKYLTSFDYSYGFESNSPPTLTLEFLDIDGLFVSRFFKIGSMDLQGSPTIEVVTQQNVAENYNKDIAGTKQIYFSFGSNSIKNENYWSDVMSCTQISMDIDVGDNGVRKFAMVFGVDSLSPLFSRTTPPLTNFLNYESEYYRNIESITKSIEVEIDSPGSENPVISSSRVIPQFGKPKIYQKDLTILLKKYIAETSNTIPGNIICIIPPWFSNKDEEKILSMEQLKKLEPLPFFIEKSSANVLNRKIVYNSNGVSDPDTREQAEEEKSKNKLKYTFSFGVFKIDKEDFPNVVKPLLEVWDYFRDKYPEGRFSSNYLTIDTSLNNKAKYKKFGLIEDETKPIIIFSFNALMRNHFEDKQIGSAKMDPEALGFFGHINTGSRGGSEEPKTDVELASVKIDPQLGGLEALKTSEKVQRSKLQDNPADLNYNENENLIDDETSKRLIKHFNIPLFIHNAKNPNVLNIKFRDNKAYYVGLIARINNKILDYYAGTVVKALLGKGNPPPKNSGSLTPKFISELKDYEDGIKFSEKDIGTFREKMSTIRLRIFKDLPRNLILQNFTEKEIETIVNDNIPLKQENEPASETGMQRAVREQLGGQLGPEVAGEEERNKIIENNAKNKDERKKLTDELNNRGKNSKQISDNILYLMYTLLKINNEWKEDLKLNNEEFYHYYNRAVSLNTLISVKIDEEDNDLRTTHRSKKSISSDIYNAEEYLNNDVPAEIVIQTLPLFNINSHNLQHRYAYVVSDKVKILSNNMTTNKNNINFITGFYRFTAFKHLINYKECSSNFLLLKTTIPQILSELN